MTLDLAWRYTDYGAVQTGKGGGRIVWRDGSRAPLELDLAPTKADLASHGLCSPCAMRSEAGLRSDRRREAIRSDRLDEDLDALRVVIPAQAYRRLTRKFAPGQSRKTRLNAPVVGMRFAPAPPPSRGNGRARATRRADPSSSTTTSSMSSACPSAGWPPSRNPSGTSTTRTATSTCSGRASCSSSRRAPGAI